MSLTAQISACGAPLRIRCMRKRCPPGYQCHVATVETEINGLGISFHTLKNVPKGLWTFEHLTTGSMKLIFNIYHRDAFYILLPRSKFILFGQWPITSKWIKTYLTPADKCPKLFITLTQETPVLDLCWSAIEKIQTWTNNFSNNTVYTTKRACRWLLLEGTSCIDWYTKQCHIFPEISLQIMRAYRLVSTRPPANGSGRYYIGVVHLNQPQSTPIIWTLGMHASEGNKVGKSKGMLATKKNR